MGWPKPGPRQAQKGAGGAFPRGRASAVSMRHNSRTMPERKSPVLPALDPASVPEHRGSGYPGALSLAHGRSGQAPAGRRLRADPIRRQPRDAGAGRAIGAAALAHAGGRIRLHRAGRGRAGHQCRRTGADRGDVRRLSRRVRATRIISSIAARCPRSISRSATGSTATTRSTRTTISCGARTRTASTTRTRTAAGTEASAQPLVAPLLTGRTSPAPSFPPRAPTHGAARDKEFPRWPTFLHRIRSRQRAAGARQRAACSPTRCSPSAPSSRSPAAACSRRFRC